MRVEIDIGLSNPLLRWNEAPIPLEKCRAWWTTSFGADSRVRVFKKTLVVIILVINFCPNEEHTNGLSAFTTRIKHWCVRNLTLVATWTVAGIMDKMSSAMLNNVIMSPLIRVG